MNALNWLGDAVVFASTVWLLALMFAVTVVIGLGWLSHRLHR